jgi:hypothetical protein
VPAQFASNATASSAAAAWFGWLGVINSDCPSLNRTNADWCRQSVQWADR